MKLAPQTKLLMIGDSITDAGRLRPIGQGAGEELGNGYVALVNALLTATSPQSEIRMINMGCSGNTVRDLDRRWQTDVFDLKPDWLSIMIGINDVWRHFDSPGQPDQAVPLPEFQQVLTRLVAAALPTLPGGLVLMTPFYIEPDRTVPMRAQMDNYGEAVKEIAARFSVPCADTQAAFDTAMETIPALQLAADRVHPGLSGHMILARAFLNVIDYRWA